MAPAASGCRQNEEDDERRHLMSAAGCLPDTLVLCHAHSDMLEHTTLLDSAVDDVLL